MSRGPRPDWSRNIRRVRVLEMWRATGAVILYSDGFDEVEARETRDECEAMGLPMGYGRVPSEPIQLNDSEARAQFRARRRR